MKAERTMPRMAGSPRGQPAWGASTLRGTLLLRMAISRTLAKDRDRHPLKAPCLHLSQIGTSIVKKLKERALGLPGKLPAPSILAIFALRFGSGSPLPLINA